MNWANLTTTILIANAACLASVTTTATVQTEPPAGPFCMNSSSGALVTCDSALAGLSSHAEGSASGSFGNLAVYDSASASRATSAVADSVAQFQQLVVINGATGSGSVTGHYAYSFALTSDYNLSGGTGAFNITQGSATGSAGFNIAQVSGDHANESGTKTVTSTFTYGVPFTLGVTLTGHASAIGNQFETANATVQFQGFTDASGTTVNYTAVPEPASLSFAAGVLAVLGLAIRARRFSRHM